MRYEIFGAGTFPGLHIESIGYAINPEVTRYGPGVGHDFLIHYVLSGKGYYNGNPVLEGQGFLITAETMHLYEPDENDPWEYVWFVTKDPALAEYFPYYRADAKTGVFSYDFKETAEDLKKYLLANFDRIFPYSALLEIFMKIFKNHNRVDAIDPEKSNAQIYTDFAANYIRSNYHRKITVSQLTNLLGISQPYLYRIFEKAYGTSPKQFLTNHRIRQAKKLLKETNLTVAQIAASVGFEDAFTFSRCFSKYEKFSPSQYRKE